MAPIRGLRTLETDRLVLRPRRVDEAATYRRLWTERDLRVPVHRRIDADGRPAVADVAGRLADEAGLLAVRHREYGGGDRVLRPRRDATFQSHTVRLLTVRDL